MINSFYWYRKKFYLVKVYWFKNNIHQACVRWTPEVRKNYFLNRFILNKKEQFDSKFSISLNFDNWTWFSENHCILQKILIEFVFPLAWVFYLLINIENICKMFKNRIKILLFFIKIWPKVLQFKSIFSPYYFYKIFKNIPEYF